MILTRFSDALCEIKPFGNNPVKKNQVIARHKIRKINTKTDVLVVPFNIIPMPDIVPTEETMLTISNEEKEKYEKDFNEDEFLYLVMKIIIFKWWRMSREKKWKVRVGKFL